MFKGFSVKQTSKGFPNNQFGVQRISAYNYGQCIFWLAAEDVAEGKTNLESVFSWTDRAFGIRFDAPVASPPRIVLANTAYNNLPTVESIDITRWMVSNSGRLLLPTKFTLVAVANYGGLAPGQNCFIGENTNSSVGFGMGGANSLITGCYMMNGNSGIVQSGTTENTESKIVIFSSDVGIMVDKVLEYSLPLPVFSFQLNSLFNNGFQNGNNGLRGAMAELIVYNRSLDLSECQDLSDQLNAKYAIY